jgi:type IV pilus secretin PilQ/predicted competence protein
MDVRSAFRGLSAAGRVDIVVSPAVGGSSGSLVNLTVTDKTWQEVMIILCQMYNLKYTVEDNYLYVQTMTDYNKLSVENATAMQQSGALSPLLREVIKLRNAKAKDLEESVKGLLSSRGRINIVERNNALLVFDTRDNLREIRAAIAELDIETYQVNIQAQLIQVDSDAFRDMGVDWQFGVGSGNITPLLNNGGKLPTTTNDFNMVGTSNHSGQAGGSGSETGGGSGGEGGGGSSVLGGVAGATTSFTFGLLNGHLAAAVANLLQTARGEVIAKPQITTIDNTQARIFMGEQVPIRILDENGRQAVELQDAGTSLEVTPHVTADGRILLDLNPEKNSFRVDPSAGTILQKQSAKTTVLVNDGETVVIAGLTTKEETEVETGVPLLKDIPLLGWLFKHKSSQVRKRDLIIFVTPHIVRTGTDPSAISRSFSRNEPEPSRGVWGDYTPPAAATDAKKGDGVNMPAQRMMSDSGRAIMP